MASPVRGVHLGLRAPIIGKAMPGGMLECKRRKQMFYLVRLDRDADGNLVETPLPDFGTFDKGADAAKASKSAAVTLGGAKVQCRRIAQAGDWRGAMQKKLESGELAPLPACWDLVPISDHFAHLWANDPSKIAFIESEEHGIIQKLTNLTPGRYITRFYETAGKMDDDRRRKLIATIDPSGEIYFATTPDEIEYVYQNGPESCMDGDHDFGDLPCWPTAPYGAGDLAIAYTKNKKGNIQSRCLCWPEKKLFGRMFGDPQRMQPAMEAEGFTFIRDDNDADGNKKKGVFIGARILKVPTGRRDHRFVVPYFDDIKVAIDMGDHFLTAEQGEVGKKWVASGSSSTGTADLMTMCPKRLVPVQVSEMRYVHGVDQEWSRDAIREHAFTCEGSGLIYPHEHKVVLGDARVWSEQWFAEHGEHCTYTHKNWPKREMINRGEKRMHRSIADRYDDQGNELAMILPRNRPQRAFASLDYPGDVHVALYDREHMVDATNLVLSRHRRVA
jgi:hypothetical protein